MIKPILKLLIVCNGHTEENLFSDIKPHKNNEGIPDRHHRNSLQTLFDNTNIMPFEWNDVYTCFYCGKEISEYVELRKHTKSHGRSFKEESCKKIRATKKIQIDISDLSCELCERSFRYLHEIGEHLTAAHGLKYDSHVNRTLRQFKLIDLSCYICQESFPNFPILYTHVRQMHKKITYCCSKCTETFTSRSDYEFHVDSKHCAIDSDRDGIICPNCSKKFNTIQVFNKHVRVCCIKLDPKTDKEETILEKTNLKQVRESIAGFLNMCTVVPFKFFMQRFRCFYCSKDFTDFEPLKVHTTAEHTYCDPKSKLMKAVKGNHITIKVDITAMACKLCCEPVNDLSSMIDHLVSNHKAIYDKSLINILQPFKLTRDNMACLVCINVTFRYFSKLLEHMNEMHSSNKIICSFCGMTFGKDPNYRSHLKRHHNPSSAKCNDCEMEFDNISKLSNHRAKVHGEKSFKCPKCFETFATQYKRQKHLIDAHGSGHPCSYCGKLFTRNSFMKDHIRRSHLKEKNAECSVCKERFFDNILLRIHMVKHVGERNFHCDICGKRFLWKKNLRGHMSSHK